MLLGVLDQDHLALAWGYGDAGEIGGPGSAGVDEVCGAPFALGGAYLNGVGLGCYGGDCGLFEERNSGSLCGGG